MAGTLTLGNSGALFDGDYLLTDGTSFNTSSALSPTATPLIDNNSATITSGAVSSVAVDLGAGNDTLLINTTLTGSGSNDANSLISLGGGLDVATINAAVSGYRIDTGAGSDTLVIAANVSNSVITGSGGFDSITLKAGATITGGQISSGPNSTNTNDGNDTITLESGSVGAGTFLTNFSKANDTLIVGGLTIDSAELGTLASGNYTAISTVGLSGQSLTDVNALNAWLAAGGNSITLI